MALGRRRRERQLEAFVAASDLPKSPGHPFYAALNRPLAANGFDPLVAKQHLMMGAARYLSTIVLAIIGMGGPGRLQGPRALLQNCLDSIWVAHIGAGSLGGVAGRA